MTSLTEASARLRVLKTLATDLVRQRRSVVGSVEAVREPEFEALLRDHAADDRTVFVHAGLSDVARAFDRDPYRFLSTRLASVFDDVLVPGFTPTFMESGMYHKRFSRPEYGTFAKRFLADADYRTDDPIHSVLVGGDYRFHDCNHRDSFARDGCWGKLDRDDVLYLNVGTDRLKATQLHYLEQYYDVPYVDVVGYDGVIYRDETTHERIRQYNHEDAVPRAFNREKIERDLRRAGALATYDLGGLTLRFFRAGELRRALHETMTDDPYYLVT